jgi:hypothetical protein
MHGEIRIVENLRADIDAMGRGASSEATKKMAPV